MTAASKNVYIDALDEIVNKYNNPYHRAIKMKPVDVPLNIYIDYGVDHNNKKPKFKIVDHVKISSIFIEQGLYPKLVRRSICC